MISIGNSKFLLLCISILLAQGFGTAQQADDGGLQLTITQLSPQPDFFQAYLRNIGSQPIQLDLGQNDTEWRTMLSIHLMVSNAAGEVTPLDVKYRYAADPDSLSRLIDSKLALGPKQVFSFPIQLRDYLKHPLKPGQYTVQAMYASEDKSPQPTDTPSLTWIGKITSNVAPLIIPGNVGQQSKKLPPVELTIRKTSAQLTFSVDLQNLNDQTVQLYPAAEGVILALTDPNEGTLSLRKRIDLESDAELRRNGRIPEHFGLGTTVILKPGETHSYLIDLRDYSSPDQWKLSLVAGRYTIDARIGLVCPSSSGQPSQPSNTCWQGDLISIPLPFDVP